MDTIADRTLLTALFSTALKAADSYGSVHSHAERIRTLYENGAFKKLAVIGFGKASCPIAGAIEDSLGDLIDTGSVITKYGHSATNKLLKTMVYEANHPVPDENGLHGAGDIMRILREADETTLVVCLISGGGSALLASPCKGISLDEKQKITQLLLHAGADIFELNTVRKHISGVKGGRLAEIAYPAHIISLILSDVIGDRLDVIASGPTAPDVMDIKALTIE
jgi:hydroxypyruvate reductase/glycerate 2-kinase